MKSKVKVLFLGFGIDAERKEAVSKNTLKLVELLKQIGIESKILNVGYVPSHGDHVAKTMSEALMNRKKVLEQIVDYVKKEKITHIHDVFVLTGASAQFSLALKKQLSDVYFVKELHNDAGYSRKLHLESLIRFVFNSERDLKKIFDQFDLVLTRNFFLSKKYDLLYLPPYIPIYKKRKYQLEKKLRLCYLGHPLKKKGIDEFAPLIRAIPQKYCKQVSFHFALTALGNHVKLEEELAQAAKEKGIEITFSGVVKPEKFYRENDVFILPIHDEYGATSTPNTVLEAMEAGCLVLVTKIKSLDGIIRDMENGVFLENYFVETILKKVLLILQKPEKVQDIVTNARTDIEKHYTEEKVVAILKKVYGQEKYKRD